MHSVLNTMPYYHHTNNAISYILIDPLQYALKNLTGDPIDDRNIEAKANRTVQVSISKIYQ